MATVSVITLNRGRSDHLRRLLEGLRRGTHPDECVIVQMGDDPGVESDGAFKLREVRLEQPGLPLAAARNAGRQAACGEVLVFLDVDCIPSQSLLTALAGHAAAVEGLVCCAISYLPGGAVANGWTEEQLRRVGRRHPARVFPERGLQEAPHAGLFWSLAFAVRATTFDRIGGFDKGFDGYGAEDTDFAFRADRLGIRVLFSAEGLAFHQRHAAYDPPLQHFADIMRNARRFRDKHGLWPMQGWIDAFGGLGLVEATSAGDYRILRGPTEAELAAAALPDDRPF